MKIIGITGSSGSGKTTMSEILSQRKDTKIINADKMARDLTDSETEYFSQIKNVFEKDNIVLQDGTLNRAQLANLIYHDQNKLEQLNQITFQYLFPKIVREIEKVEERIKLVVIDAPLLFEAGLDKYCDLTIALQAPMDLKIARICKRDNISEEVAKARLQIQQTDEFYRKHADCVIENNEKTTVEMLEEKISKILENLAI